MANMIPPEEPGRGPGRRAETALWNALRDGLSDEYFVYHGLRYVDRDAREGEADFLVLHRERGMLVIECKGEGVRRTADGRWVRRGSDGSEHALSESPTAQAQRATKQLVRELEARMGPPFSPPLPLAHGHAVAFPLASGRGALPLELQPELLLTSHELGSIATWVERAQSFWRGHHGRRIEPLPQREFKAFRRMVLHPQLELVETLGSRIRADEATLAHLTEEQLLILKTCFLGPRARILGAAGTGKTVLALDLARRLTNEGRRVLLVCFNRALAEHLSRATDSGTSAGTLEVCTFHALCRRAFDLLERPFEPPSGGPEAKSFWDLEAPLSLLDALAEGRLERYDAIIVDEGQDFHAEWMTTLSMACLRDPERSPLVVFYDPAQEIFGRRSEVLDKIPTARLSCNIRNTRAIARVVQELGGIEVTSHPRAPEGVDPIVHPLGSPADTRSRLGSVVERLLGHEGLLPEQLTILTPHRREHSSLAGLQEIGGVALADSPSDRNGRILHTTIGAFKGLESDVVIVLDVDPTDARCDRRARYVAASRAKHLLHVFARGDWTK